RRFAPRCRRRSRRDARAARPRAPRRTTRGTVADPCFAARIDGRAGQYPRSGRRRPPHPLAGNEGPRAARRNSVVNRRTAVLRASEGGLMAHFVRLAALLGILAITDPAHAFKLAASFQTPGGSAVGALKASGPKFTIPGAADRIAFRPDGTVLYAV